MNTLHWHLCLLALLATSVSEAQDLPTVNLQRTYDPNIKAGITARIDSTVAATLERFNARACKFHVEPTASGETPEIVIHVRKGKIATKKQRAIAYVVNTLAPVYVPAHTIKSTITFSPAPGYAPSAITVCSQTRVMFANIARREEKLLWKYGNRVYEALLEMEAAWASEQAVAQR